MRQIKAFLGCIAMGGFFMGMAFRIEIWWDLGDERWTLFAIACLIFALLTYFLPDELKWVTSIKNSSSWKFFGLRLRIMMRHKNHPQRAKDEYRLGYQEEGLENPKIDKRHTKRFAEVLDALGMKWGQK